MSKLRVLVTDGDTPKALAIVRALGSKHDVWTAANSRITLAACSRYTRGHLHCRLKSDLHFCDWTLHVCAKNQIQIVIPPEESSSLLLARDAARFHRNGVTIASLPFEALERVVDKAKTIDAARSIGIRVPPTQLPANASDVFDAARELGYPVVVKPRSTTFWDGQRFINSPSIGYANSDEQMRGLMRHIDPRMPPPIVQKFVHGEGIGVCMLMDERGGVLAEFAHRRLRDYRPTGSGSVLRESIALTPQLRDSSARLLQYLGCHGTSMVEFRVENGTDDPYLMEINGRFWGSLQLAIDSGVNFPCLFIDHLMGDQVEKPSYKEGVILRWWVGDLIRTLRILRGRPPGFTGFFPSRLSAIAEFLGPQPDGTRNEILRWSDCWPSLIEPISVMRKLMA